MLRASLRVTSAVLAALTLTSAAEAQRATRQVGLEAGASRANFTGSDANDAGAGSRTGPFVGLTFLRQQQRFGILTGIGYVTKGASVTFDAAEGEIKLGYIEVPVLARIALPLQGSRIVPAILGGASFAFNTSCRVEARFGSASASADCDDNTGEGPTADVRTFDVGLTGGVEVAFPISQKAFLVPGIRYTRGLTKVGSGSDAGDTKNAAFLFGVALRVQR